MSRGQIHKGKVKRLKSINIVDIFIFKKNAKLINEKKKMYEGNEMNCDNMQS